MVGAFEFRVLRENRRVVTAAGRADELEAFHRVLTDISMGVPSNDVSKFLVDAYVRGAQCGCAERAELERSTSVFTRRADLSSLPITENGF